jgi:hypothetical protein
MMANMAARFYWLPGSLCVKLGVVERKRRGYRTSDYLEYTGEAEPDDLKEGVVYRAVPAMIVCLGLSLGYCAWVLLVFLVAAALSVLPVDAEVGHRAYVLTIISSVAIGIVSPIVLLTRNLGLAMTFDRSGVTVRRNGSIERECPWPETSLKVERGLIGRSFVLADQEGRPLRTGLLTANGPEVRLARAVVRSRIRRLREQAPQLASNPDACRRGIRIAAVLGAVIGIASLPLLLQARDHFVGTVSDPASSLPVRVLWLVAVLLCGLGVGVLFATLILLVIPLGKAEGKRFVKRHGALAEFINAQKGRLEPVAMQRGVWYRYVDPKGLRATENLVGSGIVFGVCGLLLATPVFLPTSPSDAYLKPISALVAVASLFGAVMGIRKGLELRRTLECRFRDLGDRLELESPDGSTMEALVVRPLHEKRVSTPALGAMSLVVRSPSGQRYQIDPRFLIADSPRTYPT